MSLLVAHFMTSWFSKWQFHVQHHRRVLFMWLVVRSLWRRKEKKEHCLLCLLVWVSWIAEMWKNWSLTVCWHLCTTCRDCPHSQSEERKDVSFCRLRPAQNRNKFFKDQVAWLRRDLGQTVVKSLGQKGEAADSPSWYCQGCQCWMWLGVNPAQKDEILSAQPANDFWW